MNAISPKIEPRHLDRRAVVYVRQSTPRQVLTNQESTRRQYQLAERARQLGWPAPQIEIIDEDLGLSGADSQARTGFQRLVAAIGLVLQLCFMASPPYGRQRISALGGVSWLWVRSTMECWAGVLSWLSCKSVWVSCLGGRTRAGKPTSISKVC